MINRREFFGRAAGAWAAIRALRRESGWVPLRQEKPRAVPLTDVVNLGIIGPGSRGQGLMHAFLRVPGVRFRALCDIYEPRFAQAQKITGQATPAFRDHRKLLEAPDLDAIVIATPLSLHAEHVTAALASGRHVYGEKSMALTVHECDRILEAVRRSGKHFQVGHQYHYAPWYQEALRQIRAGKIGSVTQIYSYWHRNNSWRRAVPDPKDAKLERLINWRLYREYSGGLLAELGSHHIHFANQVFNSSPETAVGAGGIDFWKDGREVHDNVQVMYRYRSGQTLFFSATTTNRMEGAQVRVYGTGGTIVVTQADGTFYYEPTTTSSAVPEGLVVEQGVVTGASFRAEAPYRGPGQPLEVPEGTSGNPDFLACQAFVESIRNHRRPEADEHAGWASGVMVALGNQAIDGGQRVAFADHVRTSRWRNEEGAPAMANSAKRPG